MLINSIQRDILEKIWAKVTWWLQLWCESGLCFMLKEMSERKRGLGSWVRALICCLTPDTKALPRLQLIWKKKTWRKNKVRCKRKKKKGVAQPYSSVLCLSFSGTASWISVITWHNFLQNKKALKILYIKYYFVSPYNIQRPKSK